MLVFFYDILISSKGLEDHVRHVDKVLQLLKEEQLYAKPSKCFFGVKEVEYLGHIVSHEGVKVDPNKIKVDPNKIVGLLRGGVNQLFPCLNNYAYFKLLYKALNDDHNNAVK